jgi:pimeloyl-ACP methyl ester carboxylesterase
MSTIPLLSGISARMVETPRLTQHVRFSGSPDGEAVLFVHGNASSATYWEEAMLALPENYYAIAPDLRGYGDTEFKPVDATRGMGDWVDDLLSLMETLEIKQYHVVGHSLGGSIVMSLIPAAGDTIRTVTLAAPGSPYGFCGTKGEHGSPCYDDFAGSGGGIVNAEFTQLMAAGDRGTDSPTSPRTVMNSFYWKPPFRAAREEELLSGLLSEKVGENNYPGDSTPSANWPHVAAGVWGPANALSPKYVGDSVERLVNATHKPPILWIRGAEDQIVSDTSLFDLGFLGKLGAVPGWPGDDVFPPQPMNSQTRAVLNRYAANGGTYQEEVFADTGHTPYLEQPEAFNRLFHAHMSEQQ